MKKLRGYIFSRPFMGERAPQHVQNIILLDYCTKREHELLFASAEYAMPDSYMILESVLADLENIDGILFYSLFQLPTQPEKRKSIYSQVLEAGKSLHFAVEGMSISSVNDAQKAEEYFLIREAINQ